jgi:hypothetical protein
MKPMDGFDVRIAAHLAKDRGAFNRLVAQTVEFAEERCPFDLSHDVVVVSVVSIL